MFVMTAKIYLAEAFKDFGDPQRVIKVPCHSAKWKNSLSDYCSSAEIVLPGRCAVKTHVRDAYTKIPTGIIFKAGKAVKIECGYDTRNRLQFIGFIRESREKDSKLYLNCEGFSYQLKSKPFVKSYKNPTLKQLLVDLTEGTDIVLSNKIPAVSLTGSIVFPQGKRGLDVLQYLKDKCGLTPYFHHNELYVGLKFAVVGKKVVKFKLGWNTVSADSLIYKEPESYNIVVQANKKDGSKTIIATGEGTQVKVSIDHIKDAAFLQQIAEDKHLLLNKGSYSGSLDVFLEPYTEPGDTVQIIDKTGYEERNGSYFVDAVSGSFGPNGGRQTIDISIRLN